MLPCHHQRGGCLSGDAFAASGEAKLFRGCRLHGNAGDVDPGKLGDAGAHGITVWADFRALADQCQVEMHDDCPMLGAA